MKYIVCFLLSFIIVYLFYMVTVVLQKNKYEKFKKSNQVLYFVNKYKLNVNKIDIAKFVRIIALVNSFIVAASFTVVIEVSNVMLLILIGLLTIIPLTLICYHFIGVYLQKEAK